MLEKRTIYSIRRNLGLSLVTYTIMSEDDNQYILRDNTCSHYPACQIVVDKRSMSFVKMHNDDSDVYLESHNNSDFFKTEREARYMFNKLAAEIYKRDADNAQKKVDRIREMISILGNRRRIRYDFDYKYYGTKIFIPKVVSVINDLYRRFVLESDDLTIKNIKSILGDNVAELEINKVVDMTVRFNGNVTETHDYYIDLRRNEYDLNDTSIYMKIYRNKYDNRIKYEKMVIDDEDSSYENHYCDGFRYDACENGCVFNTKANAVNIQINNLISKLENELDNATQFYSRVSVAYNDCINLMNRYAYTND